MTRQLTLQDDCAFPDHKGIKQINVCMGDQKSNCRFLPLLFVAARSSPSLSL